MMILVIRKVLRHSISYVITVCIVPAFFTICRLPYKRHQPRPHHSTAKGEDRLYIVAYVAAHLTGNSGELPVGYVDSDSTQVVITLTVANMNNSTETKA